MRLNIPDDVAREIGLTEGEALLELACRLYESDRVEYHTARRLASVDRVRFEEALRARGIAIVKPRLDEVEQELRELRDERGSGGEAAA